jgi:hypothetical protein
MPFQNHRGGFQHAHPLGHVPTINHPLVTETLGRYVAPTDRTADEQTVKAMMIDPDTLPRQQEVVRYAIATDSSYLEPEIDPAFPSARILFLQMAAVIVDLERMQTREGPFVDPVAIADAQQKAMLAGALPSSNLHRRDRLDPLTAFRQEIDILFRRSVVQQQSMLDLLLEVEGTHENPPPAGHLVMARCPSCGARIDGHNGSPVLYVSTTGSSCPSCGKLVMAVDALRSHETFDPHGANAEACGRILSVVERLASLAILNDIQRRRPSVLARTAFVTDGPLALFGQVAPLHKPLLRRLQQIAGDQERRRLGLPVIVGIEKGGMFVEHANCIRPVIDRHLADDGRERGGALIRLDDGYIKRYITHTTSTHGDDTYYGRHFLYRSRTGAMYTITVPPLGRVGVMPEDVFKLQDYPTLRATCDVLDRIGTRLYPDATIPVALAHEFAAYPLESAGRVLKLYADSVMDAERDPITSA